MVHSDEEPLPAPRHAYEGKSEAEVQDVLSMRLRRTEVDENGFRQRRR